MKESDFDFYYNEILKIMKPSKQDIILDYGGDNGEIAYRFKQDFYSVKHCDISLLMVKNAIEKYGLDSCECNKIKYKYNKVLFHNAFFYVHPKKQKKVLEKLFNILNDKGILYITDTPDFDKRVYSFGNNKQRIKMILTAVFPVYQVDLAGFYIQDSQLRKFAQEVGFRKISKIDSWCNYRSHWILEK